LDRRQLQYRRGHDERGREFDFHRPGRFGHGHHHGDGPYRHRWRHHGGLRSPRQAHAIHHPRYGCGDPFSRRQPGHVTYSTAYFSETPNVTCSNSSDSVCTVSKSGNVITITPVAAGTSTLTVSAHYYYYGNEDASVVLPITVKASSTETEETGDYSLVTSSTQLVAGYNYIIASSKKAGSVYVSGELSGSYISVLSGTVTSEWP
jgi:hypothetical protein